MDLHPPRVLDGPAALTVRPEGGGEDVDLVARQRLLCREVADLGLDPARSGREAVGDMDDAHAPRLTGAGSPARLPPTGTRGRADRPSHARRRYSHSIVPGGLLVTSSTTRLTSGTSLVMRVEMIASTS